MTQPAFHPLPETAADSVWFPPGSVVTKLPEQDGSPVLPPALVQPLGVLFASSETPGSEDFLAGLHAEKLLGAGEWPAAGTRRARLAWVGVALRKGSQRLFAELRGGCWVRGFPVVGRARQMLRAAGLADAASLAAALREAGLAGALGATLYFSFHHGTAAGEGGRVYVLDADERCLHGFAIAQPGSEDPVKACAGIF
jgi:hypothetical protein